MTTNKNTSATNDRRLVLVDPTPEYLGHKIRVLVDELNDFRPWFVAVDVCRAIGIDPHSVTTNLYKLAPSDRTPYSIGGSRRLTNLVSEPGFYELVLGSRKRGAVAFKRWVCSEVLPSIRKYGRYEAYADESGEPVDVPEVLVEMVELTKRLPNGAITETAERIKVADYVELHNLELTLAHRQFLGRICRRLMHTHDLPFFYLWAGCSTPVGKRSGKGQFGIYPEAILDLAYQEFLQGRHD